MDAPAAEADPAQPAMRAVDYRYSPNLPDLLARLGCSLLVSTYQAGKLVGLGVADGKLAVDLVNFERPMGLARRPDGLAVGTKDAVWTLRGDRHVAPQLPPAGSCDIGFFARGCHRTGDIQGHEMGWCDAAPDGVPGPAGGELWIVNTLFSCLCTLDPAYSFVPRWRPPFVTGLAPEDRCHLNGLAVEAGRPRYVTALGETDAARGWRPAKATGGVLIDVPTNRVVARGFAMPHSPRVHRGRVYLLDSGRGRLVTVDPATGAVTPIADVPGYARGLSILDAPAGAVAFVGLSRIRETSTFGGVPIAERRDELLCGVGAIDLATGRTLATLHFETGVEEIFDVLALPHVRRPALRGPHPDSDDLADAWIVPPSAA